MAAPFAVRGFNPCESLLRHTPEQLRRFIRRMKTLNFNTIIIHYDYGWKRYRELILEECRKAGVEIILMTFGPRTFYKYTDWKSGFFAKRENGEPFTGKLECETYPCRFAPGALDAFEEGAKAWLAELPPEIRHIHMRAADGTDFCECPRCRLLPKQERWNPFVGRFVKAVRELRPDLKFESDVYIRRYDLPKNRTDWEAMSQIMFDTFPRTPTFPLGSAEDRCTWGFMRHAFGSGTEEVECSANTVMARKIAEWARAFPGKLYIHENVMKQGYHGNDQCGTASYLEDLKLLCRLGVRGVCYEAYEPGYQTFAKDFELLSRALMGEDIDYTPSPFELAARRWNMEWICDKPYFPLEQYVTAPLELKRQQLYKRRVSDLSPAFFREYYGFAREHRELLDYLVIGYGQARSGFLRGTIRFPGASSEARQLLQSRKLWDFMEEIPLTEDPIAVTGSLLDELLTKAR